MQWCIAGMRLASNTRLAAWDVRGASGTFDDTVEETAAFVKKMAAEVDVVVVRVYCSAQRSVHVPIVRVLVLVQVLLVLLGGSRGRGGGGLVLLVLLVFLVVVPSNPRILTAQTVTNKGRYKCTRRKYAEVKEEGIGCVG